MGKVQNIPPALPKEFITREGTEVVIERAQIAHNVQTPIGQVSVALTVLCKIRGKPDVYSYLFSIDKENVAGSAGRILTKINITDTADPELEKKVAKLANAMFTVRNRGDKLYWY